MPSTKQKSAARRNIKKAARGRAKEKNDRSSAEEITQGIGQAGGEGCAAKAQTLASDDRAFYTGIARRLPSPRHAPSRSVASTRADFSGDSARQSVGFSSWLCDRGHSRYRVCQPMDVATGGRRESVYGDRHYPF